MQLLMESTFIMAMGGVGLEDVAVPRFESLVNAGSVHNAGTTVVRQNSEEQRIFGSEIIIQGNEFAKVFSQKCVCLSL